MLLPCKERKALTIHEEDKIRNAIIARPKLMGLECLPEKRLKFDKLHKYKKGAIRYLVVAADIAVYQNKELICLVECKFRPRKKEPKRGYQYRRYEATGIPFTYCLNYEQIDQTVNFILSHKK